MVGTGKRRVPKYSGAVSRLARDMAGTWKTWVLFGAVGALGLGGVAAHAAKPSQARVEYPTWWSLSEQMGRPTGPAQKPHAGQSGSTVVVHGGRLVAIERNAGQVVVLDDQGKVTAKLEVGMQASQLVSNGGGNLYLADRTNNRVIKLSLGADGKSLQTGKTANVSEPYGLALTPNGETLLVTSVADQRVVAIDAETFEVRWEVTLLPEPRAVAISPDGKQAAVGFISSGTVAVLDLSGDPNAKPTLRWDTLDPSDVLDVEFEDDEYGKWASAKLSERRSRFQVPSDTGRRRARNVFTLAYVGDGRLVVPHERAASQLVRRPHLEEMDNYGGAPSIPAIRHFITFKQRPGQLDGPSEPRELDIHQPRATAYHAPSDTLFVGGWGDSHVAAVANVSGQSPRVAWAHRLGGKKTRDCAVDGMAVKGDRLYVHCNLWREMAWVDIPLMGPSARPEIGQLTEDAWETGGEIASTKRSEEIERGAWLFRRGRNTDISEDGVMACASCHPEGRADGLSWRLGEDVLQTPYLAGRVKGTGPYKWSGADKTLEASMRHTISRLGGFAPGLSSRDYASLQAYLESLPAPMPTTIDDDAAVARGKKLFESAELGCDACHLGAQFTDGGKHEIGSGGLRDVDTPSLLGIAHSAPYYHDGSAVDLHALVGDRATVHDMADFKNLTPAQTDDLVAYLKTL